MSESGAPPYQVGIPAALSPALSLYLDGLRLFAALIVFAHHASYPRFDGGWLTPLSGFGHEAVVIFFVLSGFVISHVAATRETTPRTFAISRLARLWSVALPAIAATLVMDALGRFMHPDLYAGLADTSGNWLASALFVNEFWTRHLYVGSNLPLWSLSYEFAYYAMFGLFLFARRRWFGLAVAALLVGPEILLLGPAWIAGVLAYRFAHRLRSKSANLALACIGLALALGLGVTKVGNLYITWRWPQWIGDKAFDTMGFSGSFITDNAIAFGIAAHLVGVAGLFKSLRVPKALGRGVAKASLCTFPIYVFHYPALYFFAAVSYAFTGGLSGWFIGLCSLALGILVTGPCERLRLAMKRRVPMTMLGVADR